MYTDTEMDMRITVKDLVSGIAYRYDSTLYSTISEIPIPGSVRCRS
jgi:hypothetical protein